MTKEQTIYQNLFDELLNIDPGNGYSFDIDGQVFDSRDVPFEAAELPAIILRDISNNGPEEDSRKRVLIVSVIVEDHGDMAADSIRTKKEDCLEAVRRAVGISEIDFAGFQESETRSDQALSKAIFANLLFEIHYWVDDEWKI